MTTNTETKTRPIIMSTDSVRAILDGRKTQTRRAVKPQPEQDIRGDILGQPQWYLDGDPARMVRCPHGKLGDRLWAREAWHRDAPDNETARRVHEDVMPGFRVIFYKATDGIDQPDAGWIWRPSIHMPRWASRLTLEITGVRVERVQEISNDDAVAEGIHVWLQDCRNHPCYADGTLGKYKSYRDAFAAMWDSLNAKRGYGWDANPWVWVISFKRIEPENNDATDEPDS